MDRPNAPPRTVGFWGNALFQINGMIGSGIFALPAVLVTAVGSFAPILMILGGIMFLPLALVFAWLAARFDGSGGPILYGKAAFGNFAGFQAGWGRYVAGIAALAANTHVMIAYFAAVVPALDGGAMATVAVVAVIGGLTLVNLFSMKGSVATLGILTILKLLPLSLVVLAALFGSFTTPGIDLPEFGKVGSVVLLLFYAFTGFESVTVPAGEAHDPKRDIPRVLLTMLAAVSLLYALVIWAYLTIGAGTGTSENALAGTAEIAFGQWGTLLIVIGAAVSIAANNFTSLVVIPRMAFGMAQQGMLPKWFEQISPRFLTPANSILFYGALAMAASLWGGFVALAAASTLARMLTYMISAAALPTIERREGTRDPLHLTGAALAFIASAWIASHADAWAWTMFGSLTAVGTVLYLVAARQSTSAAEPA